MSYLVVRGVSKSYHAPGGQRVHALNDVSVSVDRGETLGIMGESGCGKSTLGRIVARLEDPTRGVVELDGDDLTSKGGRALRRHRRRVQMVFQDPASSLSPRQRINDALIEILNFHKVEKATRRVHQLLDLVGLPPHLNSRLPHQLSGGQQQRVAIARALAVEPDVLVLDEAVSALDVSVRSQVMNLLSDLKEQLGLTYIFISHDWEMVRHLSDRIAVMYLGKIVELARWDSISENALHPYSRALLAAVPVRDPTVARSAAIEPLEGEIPSPTNPPPGCAFNPRCPLVMDVCRQSAPAIQATQESHMVACHAVGVTAK